MKGGLLSHGDLGPGDPGQGILGWGSRVRGIRGQGIRAGQAAAPGQGEQRIQGRAAPKFDFFLNYFIVSPAQ